MCRKFALGFIAATLVCSSAIAQEVTLRAVTAFAEKTTYSRGFEKFIERVNAEGKGKIQINYIGGPKAMPPFEVGKALQSGVIDIANTTGAFTTNVHAGRRRLEAHREADVGAAQERRLRLHGQALCGEDECDLPRTAGRQQFVPSLPEQADLKARPDRPEDSHHAGLSRLLPGAGRHGRADARPAKSIRRSSVASSTAMAGRSPASSISAGTRKPSTASIPASTPSKFRSWSTRRHGTS